jgi:long-chain acyl-CoA synthetase
MNLADGLLRNSKLYPDKTAVKLGDSELSYSALADAAARVGSLLQSQGVQPGDRIGVLLPNVPQMPMVYYGILWAGGVVVPMNPLYKSREISYVLSDSGAKAIFAWEPIAEEARAGAEEVGADFIAVGPADFSELLKQHEPAAFTERDEQDTAVILYTSGTTGKPKGAELTQLNITRNTEVSVNLVDATSDDVIFGGLPLFHAFGQVVGMNAAISVGATLALLPRFDATDALKLLADDHVTIMEGVPTMYVALLAHPDHDDYDTSALRVCVSGGAALPVEVLRGFDEAFDTIILEGYGLSETSPVASFNHADRGRKPGSVGQPVEGVEFRLIENDWSETPKGEVGEIAIKGHNVMKGYLGKPEATAEAIRDGWFRTGDLARRDDDGFYFIVDRSKDMIIRGGYNVYPREIEEVLYEHPAVNSVAVLGVPHDVHGEEIAAVVVLNSDASATADELRDFVKERVAAYKYPRIVQIDQELPIGPTGKILKREITITASS